VTGLYEIILNTHYVER